jgi:hypothetical protein
MRMKMATDCLFVNWNRTGSVMTWNVFVRLPQRKKKGVQTQQTTMHDTLRRTETQNSVS